MPPILTRFVIIENNESDEAEMLHGATRKSSDVHDGDAPIVVEPDFDASSERRRQIFE
jgi:hypothetical protein